MVTSIIDSALGAVIQRTIEELRETDRDYANASAALVRTTVALTQAETAYDFTETEFRVDRYARGVEGKNEGERAAALKFALLTDRPTTQFHELRDRARQARDEAAHSLAVADKRHKSLRVQLAALTALAGAGHE